MIERELLSEETVRYSRQMMFGPIGEAGQKRISGSFVTLIGCGALGSALAEMMVRAGVRKLVVVDRDFLEVSNLQRQTLFDENDIKANLPKAEAAARKLRTINKHVTIEPIVADVNHESVEQFIQHCDLLLDGTDNLQTRFLINDVAVMYRLPWVYGACLGSTGMSMTVLPGGKPCLRCVVDEPPEPGQMETCDTAGVLGPIVSMVASFQASEAIKILTGQLEAVNKGLFTMDLWTGRFKMVAVEQQEDCVCCGQERYEFLEGKGSLSTVSLCGRNSVQVRPRNFKDTIELASLAERLRDVGEVAANEFMVRVTLGELEMTVFPDGRAIIKGTGSVDVARGLYAKYVGH